MAPEYATNPIHRRRSLMDTAPFASLLRFAEFAVLPDARLDLTQGALLMADIAYTDLNAARYQRRLDALARVVREALGSSGVGLRRPQMLRQRSMATHVLETMRETLAEREGLTGNTEDYYDP